MFVRCAFVWQPTTCIQLQLISYVHVFGCFGLCVVHFPCYCPCIRNGPANVRHWPNAWFRNVVSCMHIRFGHVCWCTTTVASQDTCVWAFRVFFCLLLRVLLWCFLVSHPCWLAIGHCSCAMARVGPWLSCLACGVVVVWCRCALCVCVPTENVGLPTIC